MFLDFTAIKQFDFFMVILTHLGSFHCFRVEFVILVFIPGALSDTELFGSHIFYLLVMILGFGLCKFLNSLSSSSSSVSVCVLLCVSFFSDLLLRSVFVPWIIFYPFTLKVRFLLLFLSVLPRLH